MPKLNVLPPISAASFCDRLSQSRPTLSAQQRTALGACSSELEVPQGKVIYRAGDPVDAVYELAEGFVKTCGTGEGLHRVFAFLAPGDLFGLAEDGRYVHTVVALTHARLYKIAFAGLVHLLSADPSLDLCLLVKLCDELHQAERHAAILARKDALGRIAMFLAILRRKERHELPQSKSLFLAMSHGDIADYLGITREALSRSFRKLERSGVIAFSDRHRLVMRDEAALDELAGARIAAH